MKACKPPGACLFTNKKRIMERENISGSKNKELCKLKAKNLDKNKFKTSEMRERQEEKNKLKIDKKTYRKICFFYK